MHQNIINILTVALMFFSNITWAQSPWVHAKDKYYIQFTYNTIPSYNTLFLRNGNVFETSQNITDQTLQLYGEYGLSNKLTALVSVPYKLINIEGVNPRFQGLLPDKNNSIRF